MAAAGTYYRANKEMGYNGALRLRGEVFPVGHQLHDMKLEAIHYVERIDERGGFVHCSDCNRDFESQGLYDGHLPRHAELLAPRRTSAPPMRLEDALPGGLEFDGKTGRASARRG